MKTLLHQVLRKPKSSVHMNNIRQAIVFLLFYRYNRITLEKPGKTKQVLERSYSPSIFTSGMGEGEQCEPFWVVPNIYGGTHTHCLYKGSKHGGKTLQNCKDYTGVPACAWLHFKSNRDNICCSQLVSQHSGNQMPCYSSLLCWTFRRLVVIGVLSVRKF